ncbi:MAG: DinB family protein [Gemmatimonadaceae bacterium]
MNYYGAKQMAASWRTVRNNTIQVAEDIPADKYNYRVSPETMTVAETLAHLAVSPHWAQQVHMVERLHGMTREDFGKYRNESNAVAATLTTKEAIVAALKKNGEEFAAGLDKMTDAELGETVAVAGAPGGDKTRFEMLLGSKEHEMHHRGQLMQMQRLLGIVPHLTRARMAMMQQAAQQQQNA